MKTIILVQQRHQYLPILHSLHWESLVSIPHSTMSTCYLKCSARPSGVLCEFQIIVGPRVTTGSTLCSSCVASGTIHHIK